MTSIDLVGSAVEAHLRRMRPKSTKPNQWLSRNVKPETEWVYHLFVPMAKRKSQYAESSWLDLLLQLKPMWSLSALQAEKPIGYRDAKQTHQTRPRSGPVSGLRLTSKPIIGKA